MDIVSKTINSLEFDKVLEKVSDFAKIKQSRELCLNAEIFDKLEDIKLQLQYTKEAKHLLDLVLDIPIDFVANIENPLFRSFFCEKEDFYFFTPQL